MEVTIPSTPTARKSKPSRLTRTRPSEEEHAYIEKAKAKGYDVLLMDSPLESHFINLLEQKIEKTRFVRVDSDTVEKLIPHDDSIPEKLSKEEQEKLKPIVEEVVGTRSPCSSRASRRATPPCR